MATQNQLRRLKVVEQSATAVPSTEAYDLSVLSVSELHVLRRCVLGKQTEADLQLLEAIGPRLLRSVACSE